MGRYGANFVKIVHKKNNLHDINDMVGKKTLPGTLVPSVIGDLPKEISRYRYNPIYIWTWSPSLCICSHRVSSLIQGLEIPIRVPTEVTIP